MLNFDSFYRVATHFQEEDDEALQKELKEAFRLYDKEGNGYIPTSSLREILAALDDQITPDQMDGMIAEIDTDGSGTVDFDGKFFAPHFFHNIQNSTISKNIHDRQTVSTNCAIISKSISEINQILLNFSICTFLRDIKNEYFLPIRVPARRASSGDLPRCVPRRVSR